MGKQRTTVETSERNDFMTLMKQQQQLLKSMSTELSYVKKQLKDENDKHDRNLAGLKSSFESELAKYKSSTTNLSVRNQRPKEVIEEESNSDDDEEQVVSNTKKRKRRAYYKKKRTKPSGNNSNQFIMDENELKMYESSLESFQANANLKKENYRLLLLNRKNKF